MNDNRISVFVLAACVLVGAAACAEALTLYVAPNGNDAWTGAAAAPNAAANDGPLATIAGARDRVRKLRAEGKCTGPVHVQIRAGAYAVTDPIVFGAEDSGTVESPVFYEAYPGEQPVVSGGRVVSGWKQEGNLWTADVPDARDGKWMFGALWVNGERRTPARTPNPAHLNGDEPADTDYFYTDGPVVEKDPNTGAENKSTTKLRYRPGDVKSWESLQDAVVVVFHSWETSLLRVKNLDEANRVIEFTGPAAWPFCSWGNDQRYFVENLFEGLDQPGEWYLNRKSGKLYYMPMPGEDLAKVEVVAPVAKQLILLDGKPAEGKCVEYLHFSGLRFHYTDYPIGPQGHSDSQAAFTVPAAFEARGARHCTVERCEVGHVGIYGVWFRAGCQDNRLEHSEVFDLGAGAVRIGEGADAASDNEAAARNVVENCFLHDGGRIFRGAVGAWIGKISYNTLSHNEICDFRYTGISVGWSWGYAPTSANHNVIEYNRIHHVGRGQLSDMGGIYTLGVSPGTVIQYNVFHDVLSYPKVSGGWGIYFDEGSTDILAQFNLVYNTLTGTLHQHYGRDNRVQNNILAFSHGPQLVRSREEDHCSFFFERNIVYFNNGLLLGSTWKNNHFVLDRNCYWDTSGDELNFAGKTFDEWKAAGQDEHSIAADPLFIDAAAADFRLKPDSPVLQLGFIPFELSGAGLYGEPEWVAKPGQIARAPFAPPKPPEPVFISQDFEAAPLNATTPNVYTSEDGVGTARVTEDAAASGKRSLKFTDAPGLNYAFNPHVVFFPGYRKGRATASFAIRLEPGAIFFHEWRDNRNPYRVGPTVAFDGSGHMLAGGKTLPEIPVSQWIHIQIECTLGKDADGTYAMTVTAPGKDPQRLDALACGNKQFCDLQWLGFVSNATQSAITYVDDVNVNLK